MATIITLRVEPKDEKALAYLQKLNTESEKLKKPIKLDVESKNIFQTLKSKGEDFSKIFASNLRSRISTAIISALTNSTKEALKTMKAVDTELTNIQKVSNITQQELKKLGDTAYETASKYGVAADEYLSAVYTFQKAGLGDSSAKLGELATKTMLVGDTTDAVASKFIIASNAAWDLKGSYEELSKVVDYADYINNNYATDLTKLSQGMPIVASTAANMNMTWGETLAVLGTITSKTQESGTKAATAWRALSMNIAGELGTITDETGETIEITEDSIKSISDALEKYGTAAIKQAKATGKVIKPIEAVEALAQAYKEGLLTDIELTNILMSVGGKLRTNQLTALVKDLASDTSTYREMLDGLSKSAGIADSEISTMLGSWESKAQILKNTWTEFISNFVDSDVIKTGIDIITNAIDGLDSSVGHTIVVVGGLVAAFAALGPVGSILVGAAAAFGLIVDKVKESNAVYKESTEALREMTNGFEEADKTLKDTQNHIDATGIVAEKYIERLKELREEGLNTKEAQEEYHDILVRLTEIMPELSDMIDTENDSIRGGVQALEDRTEAWIKAAKIEAQQAALMAKGRLLANAEIEKQENELRLKDAEKARDEAEKVYNNATKALQDWSDIHINTIWSAEDYDRFNYLTEEVDRYNEKLSEAQSAVDQYSKAIQDSDDAIKQYSEDLEYTRRALDIMEGNDPDKKPATSSRGDMAKQWRETQNTQEKAERLTKQIAEEEGKAAEAAEKVSAETGKTVEDLSNLSNSLHPAFRQENLPTGIYSVTDPSNNHNANTQAEAEQETTQEISDALDDRVEVYQNSSKAILSVYDEQIDSAHTFAEDMAAAVSSEASAGANAASQAGASMGKALGDGVISQSDYIKQKISQTFTIAKMFIDNLAANDAVSLHPSGKDYYIDRYGNQVTYGNAAGTTNFPGGETLVNELGPELINDNGRVFIANGGKPAVVNLSKGAIVLTAEQTAEAMKGAGSVPKRGAAQALNLNPGGGFGGFSGKGVIVDDPDRLNAMKDKNSNAGAVNKALQAIQDYIKRKKEESGGGGGSGSGSGGSGGGSAATPSAEETLSNLESQLDDILKKIDLQVELAENEGDYPRMAELWEQAQEEIAKMVDAYRKAGYADDSPEILELLNKNYDYANKQLKLYQDKWDDLVDALEAQTDATKLANQLAEKQQAAEEAREALANAQKQRTVRIYNAATGQWEWIADESKTKSAQETLTKAEESYADEVKSQAIKELQSMRDTIVDLNDVVLGPALSAVATMAQSSSEFQAFAQALNAVFGVGSYLTGTAGSTKVIPTTDSHNTVYSFGDLVLTEEQASTMTLKQLAEQLQVLKIS